MKQQSDQRIGYFPDQSAKPTPAPRKPVPDIRWLLEGLRKHLSQRSDVRLLALILCGLVFCSCLFLLVRYAFNIMISRSASDHLESVYSAAVQETSAPSATPLPTFTAKPSVTSFPRKNALVPQKKQSQTAVELWPTSYVSNPNLRVSSIFYQLQAQNEDIVGWLKIDGVLEEAVVQRDNEYYLTHNALKQKSVTGALFLDENCDLDTVPTQMLIHGHNMKEGAMFGSLKKYKVKDASYYREHPFIDFNTIYENGRYVIFSVAEVDIRSNKPDFLPFWHNARFASADAFMEYVNRSKLLSHYRCNVDVQPGDRLLTLSTCTGSDENKRLIIMARKLRENENELELNMDIYSTSDR